MRPSTTMILRCVRLLMRASVFQRHGLYFSTSMPAAFIAFTDLSSILPLPSASNSRCTLTPACARSISACVNSAPVSPDQ